MTKIKKLNINLFPDDLEKTYNKTRLDYIANYETFHPGGFFIVSKYVKDPVVGEAEWNKKYPEGFDSWSNKYLLLNSVGQQNIIDKINEIVEKINKESK